MSHESRLPPTSPPLRPPCWPKKGKQNQGRISEPQESLESLGVMQSLVVACSKVTLIKIYLKNGRTSRAGS